MSPPSRHRAAAFVNAAALSLLLTAGHRPQAGPGMGANPHPASAATAVFTLGLITLVIGMLLAFALYLRRRARHPLEAAAHAEEFLSEKRARGARPPSPANREGDPRAEWEKPADWWKNDG